MNNMSVQRNFSAYRSGADRFVGIAAMSEYCKVHVQSVSGDASYPGADLDECFQSIRGGIQQIHVGIYACVLGEKNDRGPAKVKEPFFLAFLNGPRYVGLNDTADSQGTHLNLQDAAATYARQHANDALVSEARRAGRQRYRVNRVQSPPDTRWTGRNSIGREMEAVIVARCQAKNKASTGTESVQTVSKLGNVDGVTLYVDSTAWQFGEGQHPTFGRRNQVQRVLIDRSRFRFELT